MGKSIVGRHITIKKESSKKLGRDSLRVKLMAVFFLALFLLAGNNLMTIRPSGALWPIYWSPGAIKC